VLAVTQEKKVERLLGEDRKRYRNNSNGTITRKVSITSSRTFTVTIESSKLKSSNAEGGITLLGFAAIHGQVRRQLSQRYAVAVESTFSVSEESSAEVPPYSTIEHIIWWKLVTWIGIAHLGKLVDARSPQFLAEVPYQVPFRLTYDDDFVNVGRVPVKKKKKT